MAGEVTFQMTEADYVAANRDWFVWTVSTRKVLKAPAIVAVTLFVFGVLIERFVDAAPLAAQIEYGLILGACGVALIGLLYGLSYLMLPRRARKLFGQHVAMRKAMRVAWSDEALVQETANATGRYAWTDLNRWADGASAVLLYPTEAMYFIVPHRVLTDAQHDDLVATLARSGLQRA